MFKKIEIGDVVKFSTLDEYKMFFWIHPEYSFGKSVCFTADTKYVASSSKEVNWLDKWPYQASAATTYKMPKCDPWPAGYEPVFDLNAERSDEKLYWSDCDKKWSCFESPGGIVYSGSLYVQPNNGRVEPKIPQHPKKQISLGEKWDDGKPKDVPEKQGTDAPKERSANVAIGGKLIYGGYAFEVNSIVQRKADQITIEAKYVDSAANAVKEVAKEKYSATPTNTAGFSPNSLIKALEATPAVLAKFNIPQWAPSLSGSCVGAGQHCTSDWIVNAVKEAAKEARSEATLRFADVLEKQRKQRVADIAEAMIDAMEELA